MSMKGDELTLSNLPSDIIRAIIATDRFQANYDNLRMISLRWGDHITEIMRDIEKLPAIHQFRWSEDAQLWNFFLKIPRENEEYFGVDCFGAFNKKTGEFEEVYYKNTTRKDWLMNRLTRFFQLCSRIETVVLDFGLISGNFSFEIDNVKVRELSIKNFCGFRMGYEETMVKCIRRASVDRVVLHLDNKYNWQANAGSLDSFLSEAIQLTPTIEIITTTIASNQATIRAEWNAKLDALVNPPLPVVSPVKRYAGRYRVEPGSRCVVRIFVEPLKLAI